MGEERDKIEDYWHKRGEQRRVNVDWWNSEYLVIVQQCGADGYDGSVADWIPSMVAIIWIKLVFTTGQHRHPHFAIPEIFLSLF